MNHFSMIIGWFLLISLMLPEVRSAEGGVTATESDEGVLFRESDQDILFYQLKPKSLDGQFARSNYIHPLQDLDGNVITEDFPADHLHHRGIFWAWHQIRINGEPIADSWMCSNIEWEVRDIDLISHDDGSMTLRLKVHWNCPLPNQTESQSIAEEIVSLRVFPVVDEMRKLDFEIQLRALVDGLSIGGSEDEKGYGGFSARLRLRENTQFIGINGPVSPEFGQIEPGPAVDFSGTNGESLTGVAILCHPTLPQYPPPWVLRREKSMQNPVYPGRQAVEVSRTDPTIMRYRLVQHRGSLDSPSLEQLQQTYLEEFPVVESAGH